MPTSSGPGPIAVVHRVTVVTALLGAIAYTLWAAAEREPLAALGGVIAITVIALYLRNLRQRLAEKLAPRARP